MYTPSGATMPTSSACTPLVMQARNDEKRASAILHQVYKMMPESLLQPALTIKHVLYNIWHRAVPS